MSAKKPRQAKQTEAPDFEAALAQLEDTVRRLEAGDLPLEDSLAAFEKGVALVRTLHTRLDAVQTRIDELTQGPDGASTLTPMAAAIRDEGEGDDANDDSDDANDDSDDVNDVNDDSDGEDDDE